MADGSMYDVADIHSEFGDGESLASKAADWVTKGIPVALASGVTSILNTGISFGNMFGDFEKIDTEEVIRKFDNNLAEYYTEHKEGADVGGFVATSFVPGMLGIKGLKALQGISSGGAIGKNAAAITGYAVSAERAAIQKAAETVAGPTNLIWSDLGAQKLKAIAFGAGDQVLQGLAFEAGVLLTMNQNPVINSEDRGYFASIGHAIPQSLENAALFGAVGGAFHAAGVLGQIKQAKLSNDAKLFGARHADVMADNSLPAGTRLAYLVDQIEQREATAFLPVQDVAISEKYIAEWNKTTAAMKTSRDKFITEQFAPKDPELAVQIRANLDKVQPVTENGYQISRSELVARVMAAGEHAKRLGGELNEAGAAMITATERFVKNVGDRAGNIEVQAYPAAGDLGLVAVKEGGEIYIDGKFQKIGLDYVPTEQSPTASSLQFLKQKYSPTLTEGDVIPYTNLPLLEKAVRENLSGKVRVEGYPGFLDESDLAGILRESKLDTLQELVNLGKDKNFISRAINAPMEFVEKGTGEVSLFAMEDHTKPLFMRVSYTGVGEMEAFRQQGMLHVYENAKIANEKLTRAAANALGEDFKFFQPSSPLVDVNTIPDVTGFLKFSDAPYGSTAAKYLNDGKMQQKVVDGISAARSDALHGARQKIAVNPADLTELNIIAAKMRSSDSGWVKMPEDIHIDPENFILIQRRVLKEGLDAKDPLEAITRLTNAGAKDSGVVIKIHRDSPIVEFLENHAAIVSARNAKFNMMNAAKGSSRRLPLDEYYIPPIDTTRQQHFVLVRENNKLDPERSFTVVVAPNAEALEKKLATIRTRFGDTLEILSPKDVENKKIIDGIYDSGDFFQKTAVDSALKREGILSEFAPRTDDYIFQEFDNWHYRNEHALVRQSIESLRADEFAQLRFMADNYGELYSAKFGGKTLNPADNPYLQLINTSLNISNKGHYDQYWGSINRGAGAAYNAMSEIWRTMHTKAGAGQISIEEANRIATSHGWRAPYADVVRDVWNPIIPDPNALSKLTGRTNLAISTLMLRMDAFNAVVNTLSLPILYKAELTSLVRNIGDPTKVGRLTELLSEKVPGTPHRIPSALSLLSEGTGHYVKNTKVSELFPEVKFDGTIHDLLSSVGVIKTESKLLQDTLGAVSLTPEAVASEKGAIAYATNLAKKVGELGAKYTGNNLAEDFVRFQAGFAMLKLSYEAGIRDLGELAGYMNTFTNRIHGNYLASQRPTLFQGPVGQAIGLFQTYQFNMIQQMTRFLQQGDRSAVVAAAALQNTIFGMQGNPLFYQLNSYIGNSNRANRDIVSTVGDVAGVPDAGWKDPARWMLYGLGANALQVNLYSRGDLTPRYATVVPDRIQDIPAISIPTKALGSFLDSMSMLSKGAGVKESILHGIAHSGFNRPLTGLASLAQGGRTTSQGTLLAAYNDIDGWLIAGALAGGRPLNEAVLTDQYRRMQAYQTAETKRIGEIAEAVRLTAAGQRGILDPDQTANFLSEYAAAGGSQERANQFLIRAARDSQQSVVDRMKANYHSPFGKRMRDMMGNEESGFSRKPTTATEEE